jgi:hypothetical protein
MSFVTIGGGTVAWLVQNRDRLGNKLPKHHLHIFDPSLKLPSISEAIKQFHFHYINNLTNLQSTNDLTKEYAITYFLRYIEELITQLYNFHEKYKNQIDLPFKEMGNILRAVQGFAVESSQALSIIKLQSDIYGKKNINVSGDFNLNSFWQLIKAGDLQNAKAFFAKHPKYKSSLYGKHVENSLSPEKRIFGYMYKNEEEFTRAFLLFKKNSEDLSKTQEVIQDFGDISKILEGDLEFFMKLNPNWLEVLIFLCLFNTGIIKNPTQTMQVIQSKLGRPSELEAILIEAFVDNMHLLVQKASERYPSFFIAHLVDILASLEKIDTNSQNIFEGLNYPEHYFLNFVTEIMNNKSIPVEVICDYIYFNLGGLDNCEGLMIYANAFRFQEENIERLVNYFKGRKLENLAMQTYKLAAIRSIETGHLAKAIEYSIKSKSSDLKLETEEKVLKIASEIDTDLIRLQVRSMKPSYLSDSSVMHFLSTFLKYIDQVNQLQIQEAGQSLVKFFENDRAPFLFYEKILLASVSLFDQGLELSSKNFFKVLQAYEKMCMQISTSPSSITLLSFTLGRASSFSLSK